jgi:hypothetical protein
MRLESGFLTSRILVEAAIPEDLDQSRKSEEEESSINCDGYCLWLILVEECEVGGLHGAEMLV